MYEADMRRDYRADHLPSTGFQPTNHWGASRPRHTQCGAGSVRYCSIGAARRTECTCASIEFACRSERGDQLTGGSIDHIYRGNPCRGIAGAQGFDVAAFVARRRWPHEQRTRAGFVKCVRQGDRDLTLAKVRISLVGTSNDDRQLRQLLGLHFESDQSALAEGRTDRRRISIKVGSLLGEERASERRADARITFAVGRYPLDVLGRLLSHTFGKLPPLGVNQLVLECDLAHHVSAGAGEGRLESLDLVC